MPSNFVQTQALNQTQTLTPQQLLVARLTEMPLEELREHIDMEVAANPTLEKTDETDGTDSYAAEDGIAGAGEEKESTATNTESPTFDPDDEPNSPASASGTEQANPIWADTTSFYDQLEEQTGYYHLSDHELEIIHYLIGSLDTDGLLRTPLQDIKDELEVYHNIPSTLEELEHVLSILQQFEPAGVGARSLQECLILQVEHSPDKQSSTKQKLLTLLRNHFESLRLLRWDRIQRSMHLTDGEVATLKREVRRLNPKPGSAMDEAVGRSFQQITPDFIVDTDPYGHITMTLNQGNIPTLSVNTDDMEFLRSMEGKSTKELSRGDREGLTFTKNNVEQAKNFIDAIQQRRHTMTVTMKAIIRLQRPFFETGDETSLRPMTLEDVAAQTGLHISTISRVSRSKWVETTFGTYELRWFFTSASKKQGDDSPISVRETMAALHEIIDNEDKQHPLSDEALTAALKAKGYDTARRTITKYRVRMGLPVARLRKE